MLSGRWSPSFNRPRHRNRGKTQSILLMERSSRNVALPSLSGARALYRVAFPIKSSVDVLRVPIDTYIFPTPSEAKMTNFPITPSALARLVRNALNRGILEGSLRDRIADGGNPGCQEQVSTHPGHSRRGRQLRSQAPPELRLLGAVPHPNVLSPNPQHPRERLPRIGPMPHQRLGPARLARRAVSVKNPPKA